MRRIVSRSGVGQLISAGQSPATLRQLADQARTRRDWNQAVFYRRLLCEKEDHRGGNWIQYGHALKEAGFHARAEQAYLHARELLPDNADLCLQLGHLAKIRGRFQDARMWFERALELKHDRVDEIAFELSLVKKVDTGVVYRESAVRSDPVPFRVFLSAPGGGFTESNRAAMTAGLGHGDYSYAFAMRGFVDALEALGVDHLVIKHPEYISDIRERSNAAVNIHLSFYPPERMRLLKGAYNVNCFAWEFDRLRLVGEVLSAHAFADQATMLDLADELWMPSAHGVASVAPALTKPIKVVPAPVLKDLVDAPRQGRVKPRDLEKGLRALSDVAWQPLAVLPRIQPQVNEGSQARQMRLQSVLDTYGSEDRTPIFVTIFNAHDYRKQIKPMLEGFLKFSRSHPGAILLCKMTTVDKHATVNEILLREQLIEADTLLPPMISERVWITRQVLTRPEMNALFDVADHYVCTSHAEGQNLPLIEAMGRGVVPVSVAGTAMDEYISEDTAVVVETERRPFSPRLTARYGLYGLETYFTSADRVQRALNRAVDLSDEDYAARSAAAWAMVKSHYGLERFKAAFDELTAKLLSPAKEA
ncbi:hypothetical protein [Brevundimonas sp. NIBR11]|uniref:glycosyltransferase n=1 Tax=Brevundimonas sp. NIBR11 TaxID=3015999 RepID=UPI0022F0F0BC|nr:hypothetical protein [Brevundimonas sp. NIBR11]